MIQRPSPFISSTLRLVGVVVMAEILALAAIGGSLVPMDAGPADMMVDKTERLEREARELLRGFTRGERIDPDALTEKLRNLDVHPGLLVIFPILAAAGFAGVAILLVLGALQACGIRIKPRGNWAPGTPWLPLDAVEAILFFGCCQVVLSVILALFLRVVYGPSAAMELRPEHLAVIYAAAAAATLGLLAWRTPGGLRRLWSAVRARLGPVWLRLLQGLGGYAVALPLAAAAGLLNPFREDSSSSNPVISMLLTPHSVLGWVLLFFVIGLCAPVFEELVFRACAYPAFRRRWSAPVAVVINGLLFGAIHGQLPMLVPLAVLGIVCAALYELTGSIVPCIVAHSAQNSITLLYVMWISA